MPDRITVGELVARFLERCGVKTAYGVISIHNLPILDAIGRRGEIRFVPSRGEAGAGNMADAHARVSGRLAAFFTSTGTAAGNACGAMVEAQTAGTPLLHITGQIETGYLDRDWAYIHEAREQLGMLRSVSKAAYRVRSADNALGVIREAARTALTPPAGPVSIEIPIDIQEAEIDLPDDIEPLTPQVPVSDDAAIDRLAERLARSRRPLLWLGGGARHAGDAVARLAELGFGVVTSTQGRGVLQEDHPLSIGAFTMHPPVADLYETCDAMLVAGSRLRGNETLKYTVNLPEPLYRVDADPCADGRGYASDLFVHGDARDVLERLAERLKDRMSVDPEFGSDVAAARQAAEASVRDGLGPYDGLVDSIARAAGKDFVWVRDVTISNSTWGNRLLKVFGPHDGVHALGGGIGQGLAMGIGASLAAEGRRTFCLIGDGGMQLNLGELATAAQEQAPMVVVLMNSRDYGVIKNIQDVKFGGRKYFADLLTPDFSRVCAAVGVPHIPVDALDQVDKALAQAVGTAGPTVIEIDMAEIGDFSQAFAGPPVKEPTLETAK